MTVLILLLALVIDDGAETNGLAGTWELVSWTATADDGVTTFPFGKDARGQLIYGRDGRMSLQLMRSDRAGYSDMAAGTDAELAAAMRGYFGCFGTYVVNVEEQLVTHTLEGATNPGWVGKDQVRFWELEGDRLILRTAPMATNVTSARSRHELTWRRVRD